MKIKNLFGYLMLFILLMSLTSCGKKTIELETDSIKIAVGEEYKINPVIKNEKNSSFLLELSNNNIEIVDSSNYVIKGLNEGETQITISVKDNSKIEKVILKVEVYLQLPNEINMADSLKINGGTSFQVTMKVLPEYASQSVLYQSLNEDIFTVSNDGIILPVKLGSGILRVTSAVDSAVYKDVEVLILAVNPDFINAPSEITISLGQSIPLDVTVLPIDFTSQEVNYRSSNELVVKVDEEGNLMPISVGVANIIVACKMDSSVTKTIKVNVTPNLAESIEVIDEVNLTIGDTYKLQYSVKPSIASQDIDVICDDGISFNNGTLIVESAGVHKVLLKTKDGSDVQKEITIIVSGKSLPTITLKEGAKQDTYLNWGKEFDPLADIIVYDADEPKIQDNLVVETELDNKSYGKYKVFYSITDFDDNTVTLERTIEVVWNYDVMFIGHAGSYYGIMNSEEAILYAVQVLKYQCVEVDLKQTKDGVFVLSHDDTFGGYTIASTNWADLKDVEVTSSRSAGYPSQNGSVTNSPYTTKLCTLERFLEICKEYGTIAVIELKSSSGITNTDQSRMDELMSEIKEQEMLENVIFLASQYNCLIWTRDNGYDYIPCQYLVNSCESQTYLDRCIQYNLDISINVTGGYSNSSEWIAKYKEAGLKVSTYTYTQWVDYDEVQQWIDEGVDYLTCDWHLMDKLDLPESSNEPKQKFSVTFKDSDGKELKVAIVEQGRTAAAPKMEDKNGFEFIGWNKDITNVQCDLEVTAVYEPIVYTITYISNASKITESSWNSKDDFVNDFYNDLFDWIKEKGTSIVGLTVSNGTYTLTRNSTTVTFTDGASIKALYVYDFEKTISNILYKPVTRNSDGTCTIIEDENYFLNSSKYRIKYQGMDQWLYNCIKQSYAPYDTTYTPTSAGKIQIFFRMHQWMNGTNIPAFDNYPSKFEEIIDDRINADMPTTYLTYTVLDEFILPTPISNVEFLGWYYDSECSEENKVTEIKKGTTGNIVLYAKWNIISD